MISPSREVNVCADAGKWTLRTISGCPGQYRTAAEPSPLSIRDASEKIRMSALPIPSFAALAIPRFASGKVPGDGIGATDAPQLRTGDES